MIEKICAKLADVFYLENDPCIVTNVFKQKIRLKKGSSPAYVKCYKIPKFKKLEIQKQVNKMLHDGIIEPTSSEWSAPLLVVPKKPDNDGNKKWRVVIYYRRLNERIKDDKSPLPCIEEILDALSGAV